jgi:hypothetical protein
MVDYRYLESTSNEVLALEKRRIYKLLRSCKQNRGLRELYKNMNKKLKEEKMRRNVIFSLESMLQKKNGCYHEKRTLSEIFAEVQKRHK